MNEPLAVLFNAVRSRRELERLAKAQIEAQRRERAEEEAQKKQDREDAEFETYLYLTEVQRQIAELEERMARNYEILRASYGDDVIGGMAETWLSREETAELTTDEERMQALSDKFLNNDDSIKPPYQGLVEAHYVQDWSVLGKLKQERTPEPVAETGTPGPSSAGERLVPF